MPTPWLLLSPLSFADYRLDAADVPVTYYTKVELPLVPAMPLSFKEKKQVGAGWVGSMGSV